MNKFKFFFEQADIDDVWDFADEIERGLGVNIWWEIKAHVRNIYWLTGSVM